MKFNIDNPLTFPKRQVHLDFHTQPNFMGVGSRFSKDNFQKALREGNVDSITVFARCYHGLCYYPTEKGIRHPGLDFDLTGAMVEAAHEIGVRAPIYINAGLALEEAREHPEWVARMEDGRISTGSYVAAEPELRWPNMCLNNGSYCRHLYGIIEEVCLRYGELDGLFLDICFAGESCFCDECRHGMMEMGIDADNELAAKEYYKIKHIMFQNKAREIMKKYHPEATIFFNSGGADISRPQYHTYSTHFEIEDLPTVWGGYDKMPLNAVFFEGTGKYYLGMTGKFHLEWGEFGGFKCREALRYEAAVMAVYGAGCSVGDHLLYDGMMDMETYRNIGYAYRYLERIEPYCYGGVSTAAIGIRLSENMDDNVGISMILLENQIDFGVVHDDEFDQFDTVIFPGGVVLSDEELKKLERYIQNGGKVLFAGDALIKDGAFQIDCGLKNPMCPKEGGDYICAEGLGDSGLPESPFYSYLSAVHTERVDAQCFAEVLPPYCDNAYGPLGKRTNLPYNRKGMRFPGGVKKGNIVYLAHRIPAVYCLYGSLFHKRYFIAALKLLQPKICLCIGIGAQGRCRMIRQGQEERYCINITYAAPVKRGKAEVIEDITPIFDIPLIVRVPEKIISVLLPLKGEELPFTYQNGECSFRLEVLHCHETVVLQYESGC